MEEQGSAVFKNSNHLCNLNAMRVSGEMCDVTIKVADKDFKAHKYILAANLKYFKSMFLNSFQESKQDVVTMQGVNANYLEEFISFAYTGEIVFKDDNALGLLELANYLNEEIIKNACLDFLVKNLKREYACQAYELTKSIECPLLKNKSKSLILSSFNYCSQTAQYLEFNFESLKDIVSTATFLSFKEQKFLFEGIIRWIMHDSSSRRNFMNDLLNFVQITQLNTDYLLDCLCNFIENQDYEGIVKDILTFYRKKKQAESSESTLILLANEDKMIKVQFYDFSKKKWFQLCEIPNLMDSIFSKGVMLNNKLYCTANNFTEHVEIQVFDPSKKENSVSIFGNGLIGLASICACTRFLYLCGGRDKSLASNQVLRFDPQKNSCDTLPPMNTKRWGSTAIFYQGYLYVLGGIGINSDHLNKVEKYDPILKRWLNIPSMCQERVLHQAIILNDQLWVCGGSATRNTAEVYDPEVKRWRLIAPIDKGIFHFFIGFNKKLLAIGEENNVKLVKVYNQDQDQWEIDSDLSSGLEVIPDLGGLISTRCLLPLDCV